MAVPAPAHQPGTIPCSQGEALTVSSLTRRGFIRFSAASALILSTACAPGAGSGSAARPTAGAGAATGGSGSKPSPFPTYVPFTAGPKPDYHTDDPRFDDGFDNFPANPFKAVTEKPGTGGTSTS